jgi:septal ring factor EnvC (AmiA/AmiB activator)
MIKHPQAKLLMAFLALSIWNCPTLARDVATEQYAVSAAQHEYADAKSNYDALSQQLASQQKVVAREQARLKELQKEQAGAKASMAKAKTKLDQQEKTLDRAWNAK